MSQSNRLRNTGGKLAAADLMPLLRVARGRDTTFPCASAHARDDPRAPRERGQIPTPVSPRVARHASGRRIARRTRAFRRRLMRFRAPSVLVLVALLIGCGGAGTSSTPVSPTGPGVCRNYASSVTATSTTTYTGMSPAGTVTTQNITISYNTATNQLSETGTGMFNNGMCHANRSWSTNYGSVADFVDEVSVIPPKRRWASQSGMATYSGPSPCTNGTSAATTTNSYDSQERLATSVSTGPNSGSLVATSPGNNDVYTAWDVLGRPTAYRPFEYSAALVQISYDDSARTRSTRYFTAPTTTADTFDSNGNLVRSLTVTRIPARPLGRTTESVTTTDTIFVIHATRRVCR
jgi:hypothetical protein